MRIKGLTDEDFVNYKYPSMFIAVGDCDWKCCIEGGFDTSVCHNSPLAHAPEYDIDISFIFNNYINNPITQAIVIGGLEPFTRFDDIYHLIEYFRNMGNSDPFIIYTGYYPHELIKELKTLMSFNNIIIKFGRYKQDTPSKFDKVLGIELSSDNQFACYLEILSLYPIDKWEKIWYNHDVLKECNELNELKES